MAKDNRAATTEQIVTSAFPVQNSCNFISLNNIHKMFGAVAILLHVVIHCGCCCCS